MGNWERPSKILEGRSGKKTSAEPSVHHQFPASPALHDDESVLVASIELEPDTD